MTRPPPRRAPTKPGRAVASPSSPPPDAHTDAQRRFYAQTLSEGADEAQQVGWESPTLQRLRFEALLEALAPADLLRPGVRLLDVGCGLGALYAYLQATGRTEIDYTGLDLCPEMVEGARKKYPGVHFVCGDILDFESPRKPFDIVFCCGGLSIQGQNTKGTEVWKRVRQMLKLARGCVAFNLQAKQPGEGDTDRRFWLADPAQTWRQISKLCRRFALRSDSMPGELVAHLYPGDYTRVTTSDAFRLWASPEDFAEVWLQQDNFESVVRTLGSTPKINPRAATLLGIALSHLNDAPSALRLLRQAHALRPADLDCAENLLSLLLDQGAIPEAQRVLSTTLAASIASPPAARDALRLLTHATLTDLHHHQHHLSDAALLTQDAQTPAARAWMLARTARAAPSTSDTAKDAPKLYAAAYALQPWDVSLGLELAACLIDHKRPTEAQEILSDILRFDPREPTATSLLSSLQSQPPTKPRKRADST